MATLGAGRVPQGPVSLAMRPLIGGMVTEGSSVLLNQGSFRNVKGFDVVQAGLRRIGGWSRMYAGQISLLFDDGQTVEARRLAEKIQDFTVVVDNDGTPHGIGITNRLLYEFDGSTGFTPVPWMQTYSGFAYDEAGTDATLTFDSDLTSHYLQAGDWIKFSTFPSYYLVKTVSTGASSIITLTGKITLGAEPDPDEFLVYKPFKTSAEGITDWASARNKMYLVDGETLVVFKYEDDYLSPIYIQASSTDSTRTMYTAKTICYYKERLFFGNTIEPDSGSDIKPLSRIRWTEALNWNYSAAANYSDQDYKSGPLVKLFGSDTILLAFMKDGIYYGARSNLVGLPYAFYELQTGFVSAVGPRAMGTLLGGCVFVGQDDVYFVVMTDAGPTLERIGLNVANTMLRDRSNTLDFQRTIVKANPNLSRIMVGISDKNGKIIKIWLWNYKTKGWSWMSCDSETDGYSLVTLAGTNYVDQMTVDELPAAETFDGTVYATSTMDSFIQIMVGVDIFAFDTDGYFYKFDGEKNLNALGAGNTAIQCQVETQDLDLDSTEDSKTFTELGVRIDDEDDWNTTAPRAEVITMVAEGSVDHGRTWKALGTLTFAVGDNEDKLNFRLTGTTVRFRFTTSTQVKPWTMLEITLRVKLRSDRQSQRSTAR